MTRILAYRSAASLTMHHMKSYLVEPGWIDYQSKKPKHLCDTWLGQRDPIILDTGDAFYRTNIHPAGSNFQSRY